MTLEVILTSSYPIRYVAWENPGKIVRNEQPRKSGGNEWFVYAEPMQNKVEKEIQDGIYVQVVSYQDKHLLVDASITTPDWYRRQASWVERWPYVNADAAVKAIEQFVRHAHAWLENPHLNPDPKEAMAQARTW